MPFRVAFLDNSNLSNLQAIEQTAKVINFLIFSNFMILKHDINFKCPI